MQLYNEIVEGMRPLSPYWQLGLGALTLIATYLAGKDSGYESASKYTNPTPIQVNPQITINMPDENDDDEFDGDFIAYEPRSIPNAKAEDDLESQISGYVTSHFTTPNGFGGIIDDQGDDAHFFYPTENLNFDEDEGLVHRILADSKETGNRIKLDCYFYEKRKTFIVERLTYTLDEVEHFV